MFKKLFLLAAIAVLVACSNNGAKEQTDTAVQLTVGEVTAKANVYVDKNVAVSGTVIHVCRHGGKKMFIIGDDPEKRFKIMAGAQVGSFDVALEGSNVTVEGIVQAEIAEVEVEKNHEHAGTGDDNDHTDGEKKEECEFEHVTYYSLDCISVKEIKG